jgi:hypothetical protein
MLSLLSDLRQAIRQMKKSPGFTAVVIITLALGIGANTTVFSLVDAVMLRPLPYAQPEKLVEVQSSQENIVVGSNVSYPDFFDWRTRCSRYCYTAREHVISGAISRLFLYGPYRVIGSLHTCLPCCHHSTGRGIAV